MNEPKILSDIGGKSSLAESVADAGSTAPLQHPLVSIITPAYNEERYISECIQSVISQTYPNWEYIIIDNASTDRTHAIASEFVAKDPRIRVVRNETAVSQHRNHNIGLSLVPAAAKYCKIIAGDDWMYPECISRMVAVAEAHPSIGIVGSYWIHQCDLTDGNLPFGVSVMSGRQACRDYLLGGPLTFGAPTTLLYSADLLQNHPPPFHEEYPEGDVRFALQHLAHRDLGFVHQVLTFVRRQGGTISTPIDDANLHQAHKLRSLTDFGSIYLDAEELDAAKSRQLSRYYSYLGSQVFRRRGSTFWSLHPAAFSEVGIRMNVLRLYAHALLWFVEGTARHIRKHA